MYVCELVRHSAARTIFFSMLCRTSAQWSQHTAALTKSVCLNQADLVWLEAKDDQDAVVTEEFYAGGGQVARRGLEHFPQLWCPAGSYSVYGQVRCCCRPQLCY